MVDGRWQRACSLLEESPDSATGSRLQKVDAGRKAGRSDPTDAKRALAVRSSYKRAIETSIVGNDNGGTR